MALFLRLSVTPWIHPGRRHQRAKKRMRTTIRMATSTPMAHHCLRPDEHGHGVSHMTLRLMSSWRVEKVSQRGGKVTALLQAAAEV